MTAQLAWFIIELMDKIKPKSQGDIIKEMRLVGAGLKLELGKEIRQLDIRVGNKIRGIESKLGKDIRQLGVKIEGVEHKVDLLSENQVGMKEKLDATFEMVGKSAVDLTIVKNSVELIKHDLKKKVGVDRFAVLERQVILPERKVR